MEGMTKMKLAKIFRQYRIESSRMEGRVAARGSRFGIAVNNDFYSMIYQRHERRQSILEHKIRKALRRIDEQGIYSPTAGKEKG